MSWDAGESANFDIAAGYINANNGYDAFSLDNIRTTLADEPGHDTTGDAIRGPPASSGTTSRPSLVEAHVGAAVSDTAYGYDADWVYVRIPSLGLFRHG